MKKRRIDRSRTEKSFRNISRPKQVFDGENFEVVYKKRSGKVISLTAISEKKLSFIGL